MRRVALVQPRAARDIDERFAYLVAEAGLIVATRFYDAVHGDIVGLLEMPEKGSPRKFRTPRASGLRQWPVSGFETVLIFYRPSNEGIEVIRVLHGAQDTRVILQRDW